MNQNDVTEMGFDSLDDRKMLNTMVLASWQISEIFEMQGECFFGTI